MDEEAVFGGVLYQAQALDSATNILAEALISPSAVAPRALRQAGLEPTLVDSLRAMVFRDPDHIRIACEKGAAWVRGRRSAERADRWELVASLPPDAQLPRGLRRTTAETLVVLATEATTALRFTAPYVDIAGIGILTDAIAGATARGVDVEVFEPKGWAPAAEAMFALRSTVAHAGDPGQLRVVQTAADAPWAHLKVVVADSRLAYIGSANITGAGLAGRNFELGVIVYGAEVAVIDRLLDLYRGE